MHRKFLEKIEYKTTLSDDFIGQTEIKISSFDFSNRQAQDKQWCALNTGGRVQCVFHNPGPGF